MCRAPTKNASSSACRLRFVQVPVVGSWGHSAASSFRKVPVQIDTPAIFEVPHGCSRRDNARSGGWSSSIAYGRPAPSPRTELRHYRNIRASNSNRSGLLNRTCEKSGCAGFNRTFHSPRIAADGTNRAKLSPLRIHSSPNCCNDSSLDANQRAGRT
jgi:hypothetical protein